MLPMRKRPSRNKPKEKPQPESEVVAQPQPEDSGVQTPSWHLPSAHSVPSSARGFVHLSVPAAQTYEVPGAIDGLGRDLFFLTIFHWIEQSEN